MKNDNNKSRVIIIGAGPAGLTAGYELLRDQDCVPIVLESSQYLGGLSKTVDFEGNKIDIGGHRFFSKSDKIVNWWIEILGINNKDSIELRYKGQNTRLSQSKSSSGKLMVRSRKSRIYYQNKLLDYPLKIESLLHLGWYKLIKYGLSYLRSAIFPRKEKTLEDFFVNKFGMELYKSFFKSYSEKVWGTSCDQLSSDWGAQRVKSLSVKEAVWDLIVRKLPYINKWWLNKKPISLTEYFLYPKLGPGQVWGTVGGIIKDKGGEIVKGVKIDKINWNNNKIISVGSGNRVWRGEYFVSSMAIDDLIKAMGDGVPKNVKKLAINLRYRGFVVVGVLLKKLLLKDKGKDIVDNWIYIHNENVKVGRIQFFHNWSSSLVKNKSYKWVGLEYWCNYDDDIWKMSDREWKDLAIKELRDLDIADADSVIDAVVIKEAKAYPVYSGSYNEFGRIKDWLNSFENLFCIGRNGMHRYNNQDHSMLTAMKAVELIISGAKNKDEIWEINTDDGYVESK